MGGGENDANPNKFIQQAIVLNKKIRSSFLKRILDKFKKPLLEYAREQCHTKKGRQNGEVLNGEQGLFGCL